MARRGSCTSSVELTQEKPPATRTERYRKAIIEGASGGYPEVGPDLHISIEDNFHFGVSSERRCCDGAQVAVADILTRIWVCRLSVSPFAVNPGCKRDADRERIHGRHSGVSVVCEAHPAPWLSGRLYS